MRRLSNPSMLAGLLLIMAGAPVQAEDQEDTVEKIGIAAAFGLAAADGKTTLGAQAGAIEASLLETEAINEAGAIIAALTAGKQTSGTVLLVNRSETINAAAYRALDSRLDALTAYVEPMKCPKSLSVGSGYTLAGTDKNKDDRTPGITTTDGKQVIFSPADIVPALATSTSFAAVTLSVEDRALMSAIQINAAANIKAQNLAASPFPAKWKYADWAAASSDKSPTYLLPGEAQGQSNGSAILKKYNALLVKTEVIRQCSEGDPKLKAAVQVVDAQILAINGVTDKAPVAPLALAVQQESLYVQGAPTILRVAVEQAGGTTVARSNIWYTLGFPGASMVSAGLIVTFRLVDTRNGSPLLTGMVRCAVPPAKLSSMKKFAYSHADMEAEAKRYDKSLPKQYCSYISG